MAEIYDKAILQPVSGYDRLLILSTREALVYPTAFDDWNQMRVGYIISATDGTSENASLDRGHNVSETVAYQSVNDKYYLGMKYNSSNMPVVGEEPFVGIYTTGFYAGARSVYDAGSQPNFAIEDNATATAGGGVFHANASMEYTSLGRPLYLPAPEYMVGTANYSMFHGLMFTVTNKGQSNQKINVRYATNAVGANGDGLNKQTNAQLRNLMTTTTYTDLGTFNWNLAGAPYSLPNALFAYFPFGNTRLRIHQIGVIKEN